MRARVEWEYSEHVLESSLCDCCSHDSYDEHSDYGDDYDTRDFDGILTLDDPDDDACSYSLDYPAGA